MRLLMCIALVMGVVVSVAIGGPYSFQDIATLFGTTDKTYPICWNRQWADEPRTEWVQLQRIRIEGGLTEFANVPRSQWRDATLYDEVAGYCSPEQQVRQSGHYAYQIRKCENEPPPPDQQSSSCSEWGSSLDPTVARVGSQPRAWWIYGHIPPAGAPELSAPIVKPTPQEL